MTSYVTLAVTHLELQELQHGLGTENVAVENTASDPDKAYDVGLIVATLKITGPTLAILGGWLWSQRKDGRVVQETIKIKNPDGSTFEHTIKYKAADPVKAIADLVKLLHSLFPGLGE